MVPVHFRSGAPDGRGDAGLLLPEPDLLPLQEARVAAPAVPRASAPNCRRVIMAIATPLMKANEIVTV